MESGHVPSGDFSYDHVLDTASMLGAIPAGYGCGSERPGLAAHLYFALARGSRGAPQRARVSRLGLPALEMTKWFDTNYHYLVPRLTATSRFRSPTTGRWLSSGKRRRCHSNPAGCCCASARPRMAPIRSTCSGCCRFMRRCKALAGSQCRLSTGVEQAGDRAGASPARRRDHRRRPPAPRRPGAVRAALLAGPPPRCG